MHRWLVTLWCLGGGVASFAETPADDPPEVSSKSEVPPRHRLFYTNLFGFRVNPLGLTDDLEIHYRLRLFEPDGLIFDDTHISFGPSLSITPATGQVGAVLRVKPLALLELSASYHWVGYFGTFGLVQSFDNSAIDYSDTQMDINEKAGQNYSTWGGLLSMSGLLQAKVGPIAARSTFGAVMNDVRTNDDDLYWFDTTHDVLSLKRGWILKNDLDVLYVNDIGFAVGARWMWVDPILRTKDVADMATHRVGLMGAFQFFDNPGTTFNAPTLVAMVLWHAQHRYRMGQDVHQGIPYVAVALLFDGDLIPWKKWTKPKIGGS